MKKEWKICSHIRVQRGEIKVLTLLVFDHFSMFSVVSFDTIKKDIRGEEG